MRRIALTSLAVVVGLFAATGTLRAHPDPTPQEIRDILDKIHGGAPPTQEEEKKLRAYGEKHMREPVAGTSFDDVLAMVNSMRTVGQRPSDADIARLKAWAKAKQAQEGAMKRDLEKLKKGLGGAKSTRKQDIHDGSATITVTSDTDLDEKNGDVTTHGNMHVVFSGTYPVQWQVAEKEGDADLRITGLTTAGAVKGSYSVRGQSRYDDPATTRDEADTGDFGWTGQAEQGALCQLEIAHAKGGKRAYLHVVLGGGIESHAINRHTHALTKENGSTEDHDADVAVAPAPGAIVSMDEFDPDAPLHNSYLGPASMPEIRRMAADRTPPEQKAAVQSAQFAFDVDAFRKAWHGESPFRFAGDYSYVLTQTKDEDGATRTSRQNVRVKVSLKFGATAAAKLEIVPMDKDNYEKWMPVPYTDDEKVAKAFKVKTKDDGVLLGMVVRFKPDEETGELPEGRIVVKLEDVSENRGICCNYPPRNAEKHKGLFFPADQAWNKATFDIPEKGQQATTKKAESEATILVAASESGGYGYLTASCPDLDVESARFVIDGKDRAVIPKDDKNNHVTAKWGGQGHPADWDDDSTPSGQRRNGDGYTLYEEFRGFIVLDDPKDPQSWKHVRTDPEKKDIFVYDPDGLIRQYYEPWNDRAGKLVLHYVTKELHFFAEGGESPEYQAHPDPDHRRININSTLDDGKCLGRQYGVFACTDDSLTDASGPYEGGCLCHIEGPKKGMGNFEKPLLYESEIRINFKAADAHIVDFQHQGHFELSPDALKRCQGNNRINLVVHEFGHQIGIHHHFPLGAHGAVHHDENGYVDGWPETDAYRRYGCLTCFMRYQATQTFDLKPLSLGIWPIQKGYCHNGDPTMGQNEVPYTCDDGCWEQIDVKTNP